MMMALQPQSHSIEWNTGCESQSLYLLDDRVYSAVLWLDSFPVEHGAEYAAISYGITAIFAGGRSCVRAEHIQFQFLCLHSLHGH
jgi:hypothetical protein